MLQTDAALRPVLHSFTYILGFLHEQVAGVAPDDMVAQPGGIPNHPAWIIGHLIYSFELLGGVVGVPPWLPENWAARFGPGSSPVADHSAYDAKDEALARLSDAQSRISAAIERLPEASLDAPFPDPSLREVFPTVRHALTQILVGHTSYHVGQVGAWRKAMALPPMGRSFE